MPTSPQSIPSSSITLATAGYIHAGCQLVDADGLVWTVAREESHGEEVAAFTSYGERYLFGRHEVVRFAVRPWTLDH